MDASLFDYELPPELIAQFPSRRRDQSRLLLLDRESGQISHLRFRDVVDYVGAGDAMIVNNTKVFKARLFGRRSTGGKVEVLLVRQIEKSRETWMGFVMPSRRVKEGEPVFFPDKSCLTLGRDLGRGYWQILFASKTARRDIIAAYGHVPLPPYIRRRDQPSDVRRYQTIFADSRRVGAVAAPTAGFHFTRGILQKLGDKKVSIIESTLHVGPGTFKPITATDIEDHVVEPEFAELERRAAEQLNRVRKRGGKVVAVGSTSVRTLESAPIIDGEVRQFAGMVNLYVKPGHRFKLVDHLITNFHLPRSSLLVLVSAFAGRERVLAAYREAIRRRYRFYSYGDAMLIL